MKEHWLLDRETVFLNHGSFGATPRRVLEAQTGLREEMERQPVRFLARDLEAMLDRARRDLAAFIGADPEGLAFVPNATAGVNAVLRSLDLDAHDELLVTTLEYNASRNALDYVAALSGARVVCVDLPFPIGSAEEVIERLLSRVTTKTRLLLIDHVTSQTALVLPIERLIAEMHARGIDTLVDGAHAPGMLPLRLAELGAAYYAGNLHKWVCAPKGAAFLYVRPNRRQSVRPLSISHGANSTRTDRSRYLLEFDWTGTFDPTAWLSVPESIRHLESMAVGGWQEIMQRNHALALRARDLLCDALAIEPPAPDEMLGSMAAVPLPEGNATTAQRMREITPSDPLQDLLFEQFRIEVPVVPWPHPPARLLRISAHLYNEEHEYELLAEALRAIL